MKKFSLEMLRLTSDEVLGRSQMKKIRGGSDASLPGDGFTMCDCSTSSGTKIATCSDDLVAMGGNLCCQASYGSGSQQSGC
ncbi:hypothetical protein [Cecembia calidifontis]|nr:hypothetical protein [Cecembia calidifontis]